MAAQAGVGDFWETSGSKQPRLSRLLERTLLHRDRCFDPLVLGIVKEGLQYRSKSGRSIQAEESRVINGHILELGFKFPDLWDDAFLKALNTDDSSRAQQNVERAQRESESRASAHRQHVATLAARTTRASRPREARFSAEPSRRCERRVHSLRRGRGPSFHE